MNLIELLILEPLSLPLRSLRCQQSSKGTAISLNEAMQKENKKKSKKQLWEIAPHHRSKGGIRKTGWNGFQKNLRPRDHLCST
jgi:short subunit dehydrogenase-like uncharacterized protein